MLHLAVTYVELDIKASTSKCLFVVNLKMYSTTLLNSLTAKNYTSEEVLSRLLSGLEAKNLTERVQVGPLFCNRSYASIYRGTLVDRVSTSGSEGTRQIVIKRFVVPMENQSKFIKRISRELRVWVNLEHRNILLLLGFIMQDHGDSEMLPSLVSEYMERGTLRDELIRNPNLDIFNMVNGIANGLSYLHARNIVHGDLKSPNVLISPEGDPKLMDFGISHMLSTTTQYAETATSGEIGSIPWMAPELLNPADTCIHTLASDIWAFGMVVFETLTKKYPFEDRGKKNNAQIIMLILSGILPKNPQKHARLSSTDYLWDLCSESACWNEDPKLRPTIAVIQAHLYTKGREPPRNDLEPFVNTTRVHYTGEPPTALLPIVTGVII
ncbi:kinase [Pyrrhoderma noxium]|uniref:Kinase n=1 Tax=Pyrrhoderma noxium TaxID=2282107 RepID=A0A286UCT9_9AGAM|nr:kinase [Pyrrhoderma noxium]